LLCVYFQQQNKKGEGQDGKESAERGGKSTREGDKSGVGRINN
jgi:hypothetical protein